MRGNKLNLLVEADPSASQVVLLHMYVVCMSCMVAVCTSTMLSHILNYI